MSKPVSDIPCPKGFLFSAASAAIKKPGRPDIALIYSEKDAVCSAVFTTNRFKGNPVKLCIERIKSGKGRAIVVNSGNSNDATGRRGLKDAYEMASIAAKNLGVGEHLVYVSSTGVIGVPLPMERIRPKIVEIAKSVGAGGVSPSAEDVARAIMTTDTYPKIAWRKVRAGGKTGTLLGMCKGAGMIAPNMATMLCFIMTDISINRAALDKALREAVNISFNRITVDGDRSPSDTAFVMANGMLGNKTITPASRDYKSFKKALSELTYELSRMIVRDGEGASKVIEVEVKGAKTEADALKGAFAVANSNLVKTAVYGNDVNWGRVITALGYSGMEMVEEKVDKYFGKAKIASRGVATGRHAEALKELKKKEVRISADLHIGKGRASVLTCDLTEEYVKVNAEYTT
jgi:glutamate N-acetyltransferase/amino-acid N-acetyltransferase